ncbi:MAG: hypothetical protein C5B52_08780 [Bacteroidetes bacterium]|nr:MAG: hypothetical protein C5B52_08780 [Bacteroidota bacterium]
MVFNLINISMKATDFLSENDQLNLPGVFSGKYAVLIDGRPWKKKGKLIPFDSAVKAKAAAETIQHKHGKFTQIVPFEVAIKW